MDAIEPTDRVATLPGLALVAARTFVVVEIGAAGALQHVAANRRHVADLCARAGQDGAAQHRITGTHRAMPGERAVAHARADQQAAVLALLDPVVDAGHVDQRGGVLDRLAHQIDEIGSAADELGVGCGD
jgi:hypothetical protein